MPLQTLALDGALAKLKPKGFDPHRDPVSMEFKNTLVEGVELFYVNEQVGD